MGSLPSDAKHQNTTNIEVGQTTDCFKIIPRQARKRIGKGVATDGCGASVNALSPCVRALGLQAVAHPFGDSQLERMKRRTSSPSQITDLTDIGVNRSSAANGRWKKIARRSERWKDDIAVIFSGSLVHAMRPNVANQSRQVCHDFTLDGEIPLHDVVPM